MSKTLEDFDYAIRGGKWPGQTVYHFPNGYGASVIRDQLAYGGYELAVLKFGPDDQVSLVYNTSSVTGVLGWLDDGKCVAALAEIEAL